MVEEQAIIEFKKIYQEEFGILLDDAIATEKAVELLALVRVLLSSNKRPLTKTSKGEKNEA